MKSQFLSSLIKFAKQCIHKLKSADWTNPKNIILFVGCAILPFIAWYYVSQGLAVALIMSASIMWLLEKSPSFIKYLVSKFPFIADLTLSSAAIIMFGGYFGSGLVLGVSAVFTALILSWALTVFAQQYEATRQSHA